MQKESALNIFENTFLSVVCCILSLVSPRRRKRLQPCSEYILARGFDERTQEFYFTTVK